MDNLREVRHGGSRVRRKLKTVLLRRSKRGLGRRRFNCQADCGGVLDSFSPEVRSVVKGQLRSRPTPFNAQRLDHRTDQAQWMSGIKAVRDCERVKHCA